MATEIVHVEKNDLNHDQKIALSAFVMHENLKIEKI